MISPGPSDDQTISQALEVLCAFKFCRKQAQSFKACMGKSSSEGGGSEAACKQQFQAYKTCSESNAEAVVGDLVQIAGAKLECATAVSAFEQCRQRTMSDEACEAEDLAALACGARLVMRAAGARR